MALSARYPVQVDASLDPGLGRWLWLFKWLLVVPHLFLLTFLWLAFAALSVVAFFAIAVTGRYPPSLFAFNVGVLRWSWRVSYYSYGALGTDRYPPFSLDEDPAYPAHLEIAYPSHLSRGLVLVKWWLLAIPHYLVVAVFVGGGTWAAWEVDRNSATWGPGGLIGLLVLVAAVVLLFTGRYPRSLFDLVLGLNRWVLRVAAYAGLMTDEYPPFRLDLGGQEPGTMTLPGGPEGGPGGGPGAGGTGPAGSARSGWTGGRVASVVVGAVVALVALGLLAAGAGAAWFDNTQRDSAGYLTTGTRLVSTSSYAITSRQIDLGPAETVPPSSLLGTVRIRVSPSLPGRSVFVGITSQANAAGYLAGVDHTVVTNWSATRVTYRNQGGAAPARAPDLAPIWVAQSSGPGTRVVTWRPTGGEWTVVVMNSAATPGVSVRADLGATVPSLKWFAFAMLGAGVVLLVAAVLLLTIPIARASRRPALAGGETPPEPPFPPPEPVPPSEPPLSPPEPPLSERAVPPAPPAPGGAHPGAGGAHPGAGEGGQTAPG